MPPRAALPTGLAASAPAASPPPASHSPANDDVDDLMDLDDDLDDSDSRTATSTSALLSDANTPETRGVPADGRRRSGLPRSASASSAALGLGDAEDDSDGGDEGSMLFDEGDGQQQHGDDSDLDLDHHGDQGRNDDDDDEEEEGMMDGQVDMDDEEGDMTGGEDMDLGEDEEDAESTMFKPRRSALADASRAQRASSQSEDDNSGSDNDDDDDDGDDEDRSDMDIDPTDTEAGADKDASAVASPPGSPSSAKGSPTLAPAPEAPIISDSTLASPSDAHDSAPPLPMPRRASRPATRRSSVSANMDEALAQSLPLSPRLAAAAIATAAANLAAGLASPKSAPTTIPDVDAKKQNGMDVDLDPADYADRADEESDSEDEGRVDIGKLARGKGGNDPADADLKDMELEGVTPVIAKVAQTDLMNIEQSFNSLRDDLFEKRWEFLEVEEEQIRNGTHRAYIENMKAAQAAHDERVARATALYQYQTKSAQAYFDYAKHEGEKTFEDMRWRLKLEQIREAQRTLFQLKAERRKLRPRAPNSQSMDPFIDQSLSISGSATTRYFLTRRRKRNKQLAADMRVVQSQFGFPVLGPDTLHIQDITHDLDFLRRTNAQRRAALRPPPPSGHPYAAMPHHLSALSSTSPSSRSRHGMPPQPTSSWQQQPQPQPRGSSGHQPQPMQGYYQNQHGQLVPMGHQGQPAMPPPAHHHQQQQMMAHAQNAHVHGQRRPPAAPPSSANGPVRPPMAQDNPSNVVRCSQDKLHYYGRDVMCNDMAVLREAATGAQYQARYVGIQGDDTLWIKPEGSRKRIPMLSLTSGEYFIVFENGMAGAQSSSSHAPPPTTLPLLSSVTNGPAPQAQQQHPQWPGPSQAPPAAPSAVRHGPVVGSA